MKKRKTIAMTIFIMMCILCAISTCLLVISFLFDLSQYYIILFKIFVASVMMTGISSLIVDYYDWKGY